MKTITDYWRDSAQEWDESSYAGRAGRLSLLERLATRFRSHIRARYETAVRVVGPWVPDHSFVEIGMGGGELLTRLLELGAARGVGVDVSREVVETARRRVTEAGVAERAELVTGSLDVLPESLAPDIVVGLGIIEYLQPEDVVTLLRDLHPEQVFLSFDERTLNTQKAMHAVYRRLKHFPYYRQYRADEAKALLASAGYPSARVFRERSNAFVTTLP